jgi:hypothetical protein
MDFTKWKDFAPKVGCYFACRILGSFQCERIVELAEKLGIRVEYLPESGFILRSNRIVLTRYLPRIPAIRIYGDQVFRLQERLRRKNIHVEFHHLVYHAIAREIGHHLFYCFLKECKPAYAVRSWPAFEKWFTRRYSSLQDAYHS